jgi:7tm Odorant receptor
MVRKNKIPIKFQDFYEIPLFAFLFVGLKFKSRIAFTRKEKVKKCIVLYYKRLAIYNNFLLLAVIIWNVIFNYNDDVETIKIISYLIHIPLVLCRFTSILKNFRAIFTIFNDLHDFFPQRTELQDKFIIFEYYQGLVRIKCFYKAIITIIYTSMSLAIIYNIFALPENERILVPIQLSIPIKNMSAYIFLSVWGFWTRFNLSVMSIASELTYMTLLSLISMNFDILQVNFTEILNIPEVNLTELAELIVRHKKLIEVSNNIREIFSATLLQSFTFSSIMMCLTGFGAILSKHPFLQSVLSQYTFIFATHIFLVTYFGQKLIDSSASIADAIYCSNWYSIIDMKTKMRLSFMLQCSQRPKTMTAGGFFVVSRETFTRVWHFSDTCVIIEF